MQDKMVMAAETLAAQMFNKTMTISSEVSTNLVLSMAHEVTQGIQTVFCFAVGGLAEIENVFTQEASTIGQFFTDTIPTELNTFYTNTIQPVITSIQSTVMNIINTVSDIPDQIQHHIIDPVVAFVVGLYKTVLGGLQTALSAVEATGKKAVDWLKGAGNTIAGWF